MGNLKKLFSEALEEVNDQLSESKLDSLNEAEWDNLYKTLMKNIGITEKNIETIIKKLMKEKDVFKKPEMAKRLFPNVKKYEDYMDMIQNVKDRRGK